MSSISGDEEAVAVRPRGFPPGDPTDRYAGLARLVDETTVSVSRNDLAQLERRFIEDDQEGSTALQRLINALSDREGSKRGSWCFLAGAEEPSRSFFQVGDRLGPYTLQEMKPAVLLCDPPPNFIGIGYYFRRVSEAQSGGELLKIGGAALVLLGLGYAISQLISSRQSEG